MRDDQEFNVAQGNPDDLVATIVAGCANMAIGEYNVVIDLCSLPSFSYVDYV